LYETYEMLEDGVPSSSKTTGVIWSTTDIIHLRLIVGFNVGDMVGNIVAAKRR